MSSRRLKIAVKDHRNHSRPLMGALAAAGHEFVATPEQADLLLIDADPPYLPYNQLLDAYAAHGVKIFLYPHAAAGPNLSHDGLWSPDPRVSVNLVTGPGQAEYARRIDHPAETHVIGWTFDQTRPFRACDDVRNVVFAPTHPNGDGSMTSYQRDLNTQIFERLLETPFKLTVRMIGTLEANGLRKAPGVKYVDGRTSPRTAEMDVADAVVAGDGTFPTIAIARGVPTVMYSQGMMALGLPGETIQSPDRPELFNGYGRYPLDAEDGPLEALVREAARSEAPVADWKRRHIGAPFDQLRFAALIERLMAHGHTPARLDATRSFTTLALADELVENPELLKAYTTAVTPEDDASLVLWAPGVDGDALLAMAEAAIEASGLDPNRLPDILLAPLPGSPETDRVLAERADALLSEWPRAGRIGELPMFAGTPLTV